MKFAQRKEIRQYDDDGKFAKRVDEIFLTKWRRAIETGSLITNTMADQIRREAIKEAAREDEARRGGKALF